MSKLSKAQRKIARAAFPFDKITGEDFKAIIMPTVSYSCPDSGKPMKKSFPYNAVGKAQAHEFAKTMGGSMKNNPNTRMTESGY